MQALMDVYIALKAEVLVAFGTGDMEAGLAPCINFASKNSKQYKSMNDLCNTAIETVRTSSTSSN